MTLVEHESEIASHGGHISPNRCRREPQILEMIHVLAKSSRPDAARRGRTLEVRECREPREVAKVGLVRSRRCTLLDREKIVKALEVKRTGKLVGYSG
jgi:hypothetical protein